MFVRKTLAGAVTLAVTGSVLALTTGTAHALPDDTSSFTPTTADIVGVGSDTSQNALYRLAEAYNQTVPAGQPRLATFAAGAGSTITLPSGEITRPNGSGAGKSTLYNPSNPDIDFARSSDPLSDTEKNNGLQAFPFALDTLKLAVSGDQASNAPATITPQQMVSIYSGTTKNWNELPGGKSGVIEPLIPQPSSGTGKFFLAQLKAANNNVTVTLAPTVKEVQEHDPAAIRNNPNAVAPFSAGRAGLTNGAVRLEGGFSADRALYNVIRTADLGNAVMQGIFGANGFICSDEAIDEIKAAGFDQLDSVADGGVCGQATTSPTTNFKINEPVVPIETTTKVTGTSTKPGELKLTATVAGSPTPTGSVRFVDLGSDATLGTVNLIGGKGTLTLAKQAPKAYAIQAVYTPAEGSAFVASTGNGAARVKAASAITESFPASVAKAAKTARGVVSVRFVGTTVKPTGKVTVKEGRKVVGTGKLAGGKVTMTLAEAKVGAGRSTLKVSFPGDANGFGATKTFTITFKR